MIKNINDIPEVTCEIVVAKNSKEEDSFEFKCKAFKLSFIVTRSKMFDLTESDTFKTRLAKLALRFPQLNLQFHLILFCLIETNYIEDAVIVA